MKGDILSAFINNRHSVVFTKCVHGIYFQFQILFTIEYEVTILGFVDIYF